MGLARKGPAPATPVPSPTYNPGAGVNSFSSVGGISGVAVAGSVAAGASEPNSTSIARPVAASATPRPPGI
eukprot:1746663-Prorocentrum_lima.AAC.1